MGIDEREKLIGDLFSLRSGISLAAIECDKAEAIRNQFDERKTEFFESKLKSKIVPECDERGHIKSIADEAGYKEFVGYMRAGQIDEEGNLADRQLENSEARFDTLMLLLRIFLGLIMPVLIIAASIILSVVFATITIGIIGCVGGVIWLIVGIVRKVKNKSNSFVIGTGGIKKQIKYIDADIKILPQVREEYVLIEKQENAAVLPYINSARGILQTLVRFYSPILDKRDWQYLDLVIYYIQTRRADTIKEALQQVDRQKQTEAVIEALSLATNEICRTVREEMSELKTALTERMDAMIKQNNIMIEQNVLQSALLAKIAVNTQDLMSEITVVVKQ